MNEQLQWTLMATCSDCSHESTTALHMGLENRCPVCNALIQVDPKKTIFHRSGGSGYWDTKTR